METHTDTRKVTPDMLRSIGYTPVVDDDGAYLVAKTDVWHMIFNPSRMANSHPLRYAEVYTLCGQIFATADVTSGRYDNDEMAMFTKGGWSGDPEMYNGTICKKCAK